MSFKYALVKAMLRVTGGSRKVLRSPLEKLIADAKKKSAKNYIPELTDPDGTVAVSRTEIDGFPVVKMIHASPATPRRANLFIIGGGMVMPPSPRSIQKALLVAKQTGLDLWIPYYPLCTDYPVSRAFAMILATYRAMLAEYDAARISVLGSSSGGNLALGLPAYINFLKDKTPMPGAVIALSPGSCPATDDERQRMDALDKKDLMIPAAFMQSVEPILRHGDDSVPDFMLHLQNADFTGCPKVHFMYGSDEVLFALAPSFEAAMKKYGVPYEMIVGKGMFHCYPVFPICPEAQAGWEQMIAILRNC